MNTAAAPAGAAAPFTVEARIKGAQFLLEVAASDQEHRRGLSGRSSIDERGGMIFVFAEDDYQAFVMRDTAIPLDLIYMDDAGRVVDLHAMLPEPPRGAHESITDPDQDAAYDARLKLYASKTPARFAVEVRSGTVASLNIHEGDFMQIDLDALRSRVATVDPHPVR
jgi:uncharacterized membrane protein (UPF0127 family)